MHSSNYVIFLPSTFFRPTQSECDGVVGRNHVDRREVKYRRRRKQSVWEGGGQIEKFPTQCMQLSAWIPMPFIMVVGIRLPLLYVQVHAMHDSQANRKSSSFMYYRIDFVWHSPRIRCNCCCSIDIYFPVDFLLFVCVCGRARKTGSSTRLPLDFGFKCLFS